MCSSSLHLAQLCVSELNSLYYLNIIIYLYQIPKNALLVMLKSIIEIYF